MTYYIIRSKSGIAVVYYRLEEVKKLNLPYRSFSSLPEGDGVLMVNPSLTNLWWEKLPDPTPIEKPSPSPEELQLENKLLKAQLQAQTERSDFIEDCIAEMATMVYGGV